MDELKMRVRRKAELEQQLLDLEAEQKRLKKEVFDLRIAANNEQADVASLEGFSVKGLILGLTGKKEERLEQERREARHAKYQYDLATARLAGIERQMEDIPAQMESLGSCEEELLERLQEQLGELPCQEQVRRVRLLGETLDTVVALRSAGDALLAAVDELMSWIGADRRSSITARKYCIAEDQAMAKQEVYFAAMQRLKELLAEAQLEMDTSGWQVFDKRHMEGMLYGQLNRCMEVSDQTRGIDLQLKAVHPKLKNLLRQEKIDLMNALVQLTG